MKLKKLQNYVKNEKLGLAYIKNALSANKSWIFDNPVRQI
jgi:hypothetical protein